MVVWVRFVWSGLVWCWLVCRLRLVYRVWLVWFLLRVVSFTLIDDFLGDLVILVNMVVDCLLTAIRKMDIVGSRLAMLINVLVVTKICAIVIVLHGIFKACWSRVVARFLMVGLWGVVWLGLRGVMWLGLVFGWLWVVLRLGLVLRWFMMVLPALSLVWYSYGIVSITPVPITLLAVGSVDRWGSIGRLQGRGHTQGHS